MPTFPLTNSKNNFLEELSSRWHSCEQVGAIQAAAEGLMEQCEEFIELGALIDWICRHFLSAIQHVWPDYSCLGQGLSWLRQLGLLEDLQVSFQRKETGVKQAVVQSLRDACVAELEQAYQIQLLWEWVPQWEDRVALAQQWLRQCEENGMEPWELAESLPDIMESVCQQGLLLKAFSCRGDFWNQC